jgi:hypothetical protein
MDETTKVRRERWSMRPCRADIGRMNRMRQRMETVNRGQVLRRALEFMDRCSEADAVWIEINGERQRIFIP